MGSVILVIMVFIAPTGQAVGGRTLGTADSMEMCLQAQQSYGMQDAGDGVVSVVVCADMGAPGGEPV